MKKGSPQDYYAEIGCSKRPTQKSRLNPMNAIHYVGFGVHKKTISFCVKTAAGQIVEEGWKRNVRCCGAGRQLGNEPGVVQWKRRCSVRGSTTP
jgi:hypothetical protein